MCWHSVLLEETLIFSHMDFQLRTIDLKLQTLCGSKECLSNMSREELIVQMMSPRVNYGAVNYRFALKTHFLTHAVDKLCIISMTFQPSSFSKHFRIFLSLHSDNHHSPGVAPVSITDAETVPFWGKTAGNGVC